MIKELFRQSSWYFLGYGAGFILGLIAFPIWTRYFTIEEYGILSLIAVGITFATPITKLGLHKSVLRFFSEFRNGKSDLPEATFYTTFFIGSLTLGVLIGLLILGGIIVSGPEQIDNTKTHSLFILAGLTLILIPGNSIYFPFLRVEEKPKEFVFIKILQSCLRLTLSVLFVFVFLLGLHGIYFSALCVQAVMLFYVFFALKRQNKFMLSSFSMGLLIEALQFGVPLIAATLANHISNLGDRFVLQLLLGSEAVGLYAVGYGLTTQLKSLLAVGMFVITPMYVKIWHEQGRKKTEQFLNSVLDFYLMVAIPAIILFSAFGGDILVLLASSKYQQAQVLIPYLAAPLLLHGAISIYTAGIFIHKKTKLILYFTVGAGTLNIILNLILIPTMGIVGAAVATLVSYAFLIALANIFSSKFLRVRLNYTGIMKYLAASVVAATFLRFITIEIFFGIILKLLIGIVIYSASMWVFDARIRQKVRMAFHRL
ncbi:oligosaccharide flippase family protein [candidate division KSB1 bacterium]|nr:oligosaccharide flippase family protein [candidate division KSB1 bacterium]NIR71677.1 oligosaccharide flippase family protein [candidate division KSB1 bacterium]NIS26389.1 oligosaccharide flippase family protein [candidate division KSB1 bacterium]NIT73148.1 oligosaccharide flippase family protein [candidate division KSB1 bacterium]NIU27075.1 oligosaccharide flippase family protein [candidate division KSB1 bacterium]